MSFDRLNEIMATPIPPPLPIEQKPVVDDDFLLRRFIGPNADHYIAIYNTARAKNPNKPFGVTRSWSWPAALCFLPWALYRKMWLFGGSTMLLMVMLTGLFPSGGNFISIGFAGATGAISNGIYLQLVAKKIAKLKAISHTDEELLSRIYRAGSVSEVGAWYGVFVMILAAALAFVTAFNKQ